MDLRRALLLVAALLLVPALSLPSLEIDASATVGNLGFSKDRNAGDTSLPNDSFLWGFDLALSTPVSETVTLDAGIRRSLTSLNALHASLSHDAGFARIAVGSYVGIANDLDYPLKLVPGISALLNVQLAGIGFLELSADRPLTQEPSSAGDYWQQSTQAHLGVYGENVLPGFRIDRREFFVAESGSEQRLDRVTTYAITADIFSKNVPYRIFLTFGYENHEKRFLKDGDTQTKQALGSGVFGAEVTVDVNERTTVWTELTNGLYTFGREDLLGKFSENTYFFRTTAGVRLKL